MKVAKFIFFISILSFVLLTIDISNLGAVWPNMPIEPTDLQIFDGLNVTSEAWLPILGSGYYGTAFESVHLVYVSGLDTNATVKEFENVPITVIKPLWFAALGLKLMLICILAVTSRILWNKGYAPVAHDEMRMAELLRRRIEELDPRITISRKDKGASKYKPGISGGVDQTDPNYHVHASEALFY